MTIDLLEGGGAIARWEVEPLFRARRGLDERLALAAPWLVGLGLSLSARARGGSLLRRGLLAHLVRVGIDQVSRRDYEALWVGVSPDVEVQMMPDAPDARPVGVEPAYRGHDDYARLCETFRSDLEDFRWELHELLDPGGRRLGGRVERIGRGVRSGIEVRDTDFYVWEFENGLLRRQWVFATESPMLRLLTRASPV